jgi:hypothetical protein
MHLSMDWCGRRRKSVLGETREMIQPMEWAGDFVAMVIYLAVGIKLWALSRRTGQSAERILSISMLCWGVSYLAYDLPFLLSGGKEQILPYLSIGSYFISDLGNFALAVFTWLVFRRQAVWARALVAAVGVLMLVGLGGSAWAGDWDLLGVNGNAFYWFERIGASATSVWLGIEAVGRYLPARRRRALGLSDAMVCNHFALWGVTAALWITMDAALVAQSLIEVAANSEGLAYFIQFDLAFAVLGAVLIGVIFFPPAFYRRWIVGAEACEA